MKATVSASTKRGMRILFSQALMEGWNLIFAIDEKIKIEYENKKIVEKSLNIVYNNFY